MIVVTRVLVSSDFIVYHFNHKLVGSQHLWCLSQKKLPYHTYTTKITKHTEKTPLSMKHFVVFVSFVVKTLVVSRTAGWLAATCPPPRPPCEQGEAGGSRAVQARRVGKPLPQGAICVFTRRS